MDITVNCYHCKDCALRPPFTSEVLISEADLVGEIPHPVCNFPHLLQRISELSQIMCELAFTSTR